MASADHYILNSYNQRVVSNVFVVTGMQNFSNKYAQIIDNYGNITNTNDEFFKSNDAETRREPLYFSSEMMQDVLTWSIPIEEDEEDEPNNWLENGF